MIVRLTLFGLFLIAAQMFIPMMTAASDLPTQKISIQQEKIGLRDLLTSLLEETKFKFTLSNNVTNDKQIAIDVTDKAWDEVFKSVLSEGGLNYRITAKQRILISP